MRTGTGAFQIYAPFEFEIRSCRTSDRSSSQRSACSISSSCLSRSVNSIARRRNWRATAARRCSSSARRSSRPLLSASVCMVVAPVVWRVKLQTLQYVAGGLTWPACTATDNTIDDQPTPTRDRHHRQRYRPTGSVPADARVADRRCRSRWSFCRARCSRWWCVRRCRLAVGMPTGTRRLAISQAPAHPTSTRPRGSGAAKRTAVPARAQRNWVDRRRAFNPAGMAKTGLAGSAPRRPQRDPGRPWRQVAVTNAHRRALGSCTAAAPRWKSDRADPGFTPGPRAYRRASAAVVANPPRRTPVSAGRTQLWMADAPTVELAALAAGVAGENHHRHRAGWLGSRRGADQAAGHAVPDPANLRTGVGR